MIISVIDAAQRTSDRQEVENQALIISKVTWPLRDMQENANTYVNGIDGSVLLLGSLIYFHYFTVTLLLSSLLPRSISQFDHIRETNIKRVHWRNDAKRAAICLVSSSGRQRQQALCCCQRGCAKAEVSGVKWRALITTLALVLLWQMHIFLHRLLRWAADAGVDEEQPSTSIPPHPSTHTCIKKQNKKECNFPQREKY